MLGKVGVVMVNVVMDWVLGENNFAAGLNAERFRRNKMMSVVDAKRRKLTIRSFFEIS
jgi:hypothetical protein